MENTSTLIDTFVRDLTAFVRKDITEQAIAALGGKQERAVRVKARNATQRNATHGHTANDANVLAFIEKNPGSRSEHITKALGMNAAELRKHVAMLGKKIRTNGQRRGTTYFAR